MGMLQNTAPPNLPAAPAQYEPSYGDRINSILTLFFGRLNAVQVLSISGANISLDTLPTEATATMRAGDVYRDSIDGSLHVYDGVSPRSLARSDRVLLWLSM